MPKITPPSIGAKREAALEGAKLAVELFDLEEWLLGREAQFPCAKVAKYYTALAHDWYALGVKDEGARLLNRADYVCPGYFSIELPLDMADDRHFDYLVKRLPEVGAAELMASLGAKL